MLCSFTFIKNRFNQCVIIFTLWWFYWVYILHILKKAGVCLRPICLFWYSYTCIWMTCNVSEEKKVTFLECFSQYKNFTPPKHHHIAPKITNPWCMSNNCCTTHTYKLIYRYTGLHVYTFVFHSPDWNKCFISENIAGQDKDMNLLWPGVLAWNIDFVKRSLSKTNQAWSLRCI